ncbi:MAG: SEC-C metal-binding domain-containing protein [bacterium]
MANKIRRNDPCPCGSGKKYKHCCYQRNYIEVTPEKKTVHFTLDDGSKTSTPITSLDSIPAHNKNALTPTHIYI